MKRPFLIISVFFLLGCISGLYLHYYFILLLFSALSWLFFFLMERKLSWSLLFLSILISGGYLSSKEKAGIENSWLYRRVNEDYIDLKGKLFKNPEFSKWGTKLYLKTKDGKIIISVNGFLKGYYRGDRIQGSAKVIPTNHPCNFGVNRKNLFLSQGISAYGYSKSGLFFKKLSAFPLSFFYRLKGKASMKINSLPSPYSSVLSALILGQRYGMGERERRSLKRAGIYHLMAISGAHVGIFLYFIWLLTGIFTYRKKVRLHISLASLLFFYLWMQGSPSVDRAVVIASLIIGGKLLWRDINYVNLLSLSLIISLIFSPLSFLSPGFQLTYFVTLGLALFSEKFRGFSKIEAFFLFSSVAFLFSLPISLFHFHRANFLSPLNNMIAATVVPLIIVLGIGWVLGISFLLLPIKELVNLILLLDSLKFPIITVPNIALIFILLTCLILVFSPQRKILLLIPVLLLFFPGKKPKRFEVLFIDVGQGDSVLVKCPPKVFLYDGGGSTSKTFDVGEYITSQAIWAQGIRKIDWIFASHYHSDHAGGLISVLENFPYDVFLYSEKPKEDPIFNRLMMEVPTEKRKRIFKGNIFKLGSCKIKVLNPPPVSPERTRNNDSLVLLVSHGKEKLLLTGDIGKRIERKIIPELGRISILKVAHHGSITSSSKDFISELSPDYSVISAGLFNRFNFPSKKILKRLAEKSKKVLLTSKCGAIKIWKEGYTTCLSEGNYR